MTTSHPLEILLSWTRGLRAPRPLPATFRDKTICAAPHVLIARRAQSACEALGEHLSFADGEGRVLLVDDGTLSVFEPTLDGATLHALTTKGPSHLPEALALATRRGAFDLVVVGIETSFLEPSRGALARELVRICRLSPPRPWLVVGVGRAGWRDPVMGTLRELTCTRCTSGP